MADGCEDEHSIISERAAGPVPATRISHQRTQMQPAAMTEAVSTVVVGLAGVPAGRRYRDD
jgi:hypothetical protein